MKRDMSLIRELLMYVEQQPADGVIQQVLVPDGIDPGTVGEHIELLIERGLVEGEVIDPRSPSFASKRRLTWEGHDFLAAIRNDTVWRKILAKARELGDSLTLEVAKELGKTYLLELAGA